MSTNYYFRDGTHIGKVSACGLRKQRFTLAQDSFDTLGDVLRVFNETQGTVFDETGKEYMKSYLYEALKDMDLDVQKGEFY